MVVGLFPVRKTHTFDRLPITQLCIYIHATRNGTCTFPCFLRLGTAVTTHCCSLCANRKDIFDFPALASPTPDSSHSSAIPLGFSMREKKRFLLDKIPRMSCQKLPNKEHKAKLAGQSVVVPLVTADWRHWADLYASLTKVPTVTDIFPSNRPFVLQIAWLG